MTLPSRLVLPALIVFCYGLQAPRLSAETAPADPDLSLLRENKIPTDGAGLVEFFRSRTINPGDEARIAKLIQQLADESFEKREEASRLLVRAGDRAKVALQKALMNPDVEVVRRAEECLEQISRGMTSQTVTAAVRVLANRHPDGAAEALLDYLPSAEDATVAEEIYRSLGQLAGSDEKAKETLGKAISEKTPLKRAAAGSALAQARIAAQLPAVRKLLQDPEPIVRFRVALALASVPDREAIPALIGLLDESKLSSGDRGRLEDLLYRIADEEAPKVLPGSDPAGRARYREAWEAWWKAHRDIDLARLEKATRTLGYTLVVLLDESKVMDLDAANKPRWQVGELMFPLDVQLLSGDRILVAEHNGGRVTERNRDGKVLWEKKIDSPLVAQRLPSGNTFIATRQQLIEVTPEGKEVFSYTRPGGEIIMRAERLRNGDIALVTQLGVSRFVRLDSTGKELKSFGVNVRTSGGRIDVQPNGNILIPENGDNRVVEYNPEGKIVWEAGVDSPIVASRLPNGHTLVTSMNPEVGAVELDRTGKQVWQFKAETRVTRAYRR